MRNRLGRTAAFPALLLLVGGLAWAAYPRHPSLTAFDADRMAEADAAMWRDYYDKRYFSLFARLYGLHRDEFGFSPFDSLRIAFDAADAARRFQPTKSREEANSAIPALVGYYSLLAKAAPARFDPAEAARLELDWWQARRENIGPDAYGLTIARISSLLYGVDAPRLSDAGVARARAMAYRDAHGEAMSEADWRALADQLRAAYRALKAGTGAAGANPVTP